MLRQLLLFLFLLAAVLPPYAQERRRLPPPPPSSDPEFSQSRGVPREPTPEETQREKDMKKAQAKQRYQEIRRDTDHLLALATQLKHEVDTAGQETLSLGVVKKADEIEKLAKSVKSKMRGD